MRVGRSARNLSDVTDFTTKHYGALDARCAQRYSRAQFTQYGNALWQYGFGRPGIVIAVWDHFDIVDDYGPEDTDD